MVASVSISYRFLSCMQCIFYRFGKSITSCDFLQTLSVHFMFSMHHGKCITFFLVALLSHQKQTIILFETDASERNGEAIYIEMFFQLERSFHFCNRHLFAAALNIIPPYGIDICFCSVFVHSVLRMSSHLSSYG